MKKISLILIAAMLLSVGSVFANYAVIGKNPSKTLSEQIEGLLSKHEFEVREGSEISALVYFTVNNESEIVVLAVDTNDETLKAYLKRRLNYVVVDGTIVYETGVTYKIPVRIKG